VGRTPLALLAIAVAALSLTAASCEPASDEVATDAVRRATVTEVVDVPASVTAKAAATVTAPADGTLVRLDAQPGTTVAKDAVIAVIDSPSARKRLADAEAALAAANGVGGGVGTVDLSGAQKGLDAAARDAFSAARSAAGQIADSRLRSALLAQVVAAERHYDSAAQVSRKLQRQVQQGLASIGDAVAALGAAQKAQAMSAYDVAKSTVDALTLRAPIAGVVQLTRPAAGAAADPLAGLLGAVSGTGLPPGAGAGSGMGSVTGSGTGSAGASEQAVAGVDDILAVGDRVSAGAAIVTIVDISEVGLVGEVDETDVLLVSPGVAAVVKLDAAPDLEFEATVDTVDLLPSPSTRGGVAYRIRLAFRPMRAGDGEQARPTPRPGMSAVAHLQVRKATDAVAVPAAAVFASDLGDTVWLLGKDGAVRQSVEVGVKGEDLVQILSGLEPGQRVVVRGTDKVTPGQDLS
jgi:HlyD family secretion protein